MTTSTDCKQKDNQSMNQTSKAAMVRKSIDYSTQHGFCGDRSLGEHTLKILEYYLTRHFKDNRRLSTLETGFGPSSLLFSHYAKFHEIHDPTRSAPSTFKLIKGSPFGKNCNLSFVGEDYTINPTRPVYETLDILLLGAATQFPFAEINYFKLIRRLKPNGILIVNNADIPSNQNLLNFLSQGSCFFNVSEIENTVFFLRTEEPLSLDAGAPWFEQLFSAQNYKGETWKDFRINLPMPTNLVFSGHQTQLDQWFGRGFWRFNGLPATNGRHSSLTLDFQQPIHGDVTIILDVEVVAADERVDAGCQIFVNQMLTPQLQFSGAKNYSIELTANIDNRTDICFDFYHKDVRPASTLSLADDHQMQPFMQPNFFVRSISVQQKEQPRSLQRRTRMDGSIVSFFLKEHTFRFFVENSNDSIQGHHFVGEFYEREELELITRHVSKSARILDIGANIGNHSVWFEKILDARRILPVEPQASIVEIFKTNCRLNNLTTIDERCLGMALGDVNQMGYVEIEDDFNPAGARIEPSAEGEIQIRIGDEVLVDDEIDFIKIDVEGAELNVLRGLEELISRCKPLFFVEVWDDNRSAFDEIMARYGYEVVEEFRRYDVATNFMMRHKEKGTSAMADI